MLLEKILYFRKVGIPLGQPAHKDWLPAHELALSIDISAHLPSLEVERDDALRYLKKEDMSLTNFGKGWKLIKFNNLNLGWAKCLDNRMNNYLPKHWRIRMAIPDMDVY
jgi:NOL1/NOP2/fmu family ribosome biogenesis protein